MEKPFGAFEKSLAVDRASQAIGLRAFQDLLFVALPGHLDHDKRRTARIEDAFEMNHAEPGEEIWWRARIEGAGKVLIQAADENERMYGQEDHQGAPARQVLLAVGPQACDRQQQIDRPGTELNGDRPLSMINVDGQDGNGQ